MTENAAPAHGREVLDADLVPYASPKCRTCFGQGTLVHHVPTESTTSIVGNKYAAMAQPCGCTFDRFMKANQEKLVRDSGRVFWASPEVK